MPTKHAVRHVALAPPPEEQHHSMDSGSQTGGRPKFERVTETLNDMWTNVAHTHAPQVSDKQEDHQQYEAICQ